MILMTIIKEIHQVLCMDNILLYIKKQVINKINLYTIH